MKNRTYKTAGIFNSQEQAEAYFVAYDALLSIWPVSPETMDLSTSFGITPINAVGPKDGPPIFLFPGFGSNSTMCYENVGEISKYFRIYAVDMLYPDPCPCGSRLPSVRVIGRTDEILAFQSVSCVTVRLLSLPLWSVIKETPGVMRFQVIQTAPKNLSVRVEAKIPSPTDSVWQALKQRVRDFLIA